MKETKYTAPMPEIDKVKISTKAGEFLKDLTNNEFTIIEVKEVIRAMSEITDYKKNTSVICDTNKI